jgi:hypothetical protein
MNRAAKGARLENMCVHELEAEGFRAARFAASKGPGAIDVVAKGPVYNRWIQVKGGGKAKSNVAKIKSGVKSELKDEPVPEGDTTELWIRLGTKWLKFVLVDNGSAWSPLVISGEGTLSTPPRSVSSLGAAVNGALFAKASSETPSDSRRPIYLKED